MLKHLFIVVLLIPCKALVAQWPPCIDSGRVSPTYQCNEQFYNPVCGCNSVTYRNQCDATNVHGITSFRSGVCAGIDLDFFPNPVGPTSMLTINISFPEFVFGNYDLKIIDLYGKTWEHRTLNNINRSMVQIDASVMMTGIYMIVLTGNNNSVVVRKLAKY